MRGQPTATGFVLHFIEIIYCLAVIHVRRAHQLSLRNDGRVHASLRPISSQHAKTCCATLSHAPLLLLKTETSSANDAVISASSSTLETLALLMATQFVQDGLFFANSPNSQQKNSGHRKK